MNIDRQIREWAVLCESDETKRQLCESLQGEFENGQISKSLSEMMQRCRWKLIKAVYVNDKSLISKDFQVSKDSVDFKAAGSKIDDNTLVVPEMIKVLEQNSDKYCTFEGKRVTYFDYDIEDSDGSYLPIMYTDDSVSESEMYDKAKKIGYLGNDEENRIADWLKTDYAKWKQHCLDVFLRISNGDEEKAQGWFDDYNTLASDIVGTRHWDSEANGYVDQQDAKKRLEKELGDDPEVKVLMDKLEEKWKKDAQELTRFYDTSSSRGGWTGD